jgi:hypothetical protein
MQHRQLNYRRCLAAALLAILCGASNFPSRAAGISRPTPPNPILDGGPAGPCDPQRDSPDYVANTDAGGHPVRPADLAAEPIPVPGHLEVPLRNGRRRAPTYVEADGKKLEPLLNPAGACAKPDPH